MNKKFIEEVSKTAVMKAWFTDDNNIGVEFSHDYDGNPNTKIPKNNIFRASLFLYATIKGKTGGF